MKYHYHTVIIGGGSAGISAARTFADFGIKVLIIEKAKMGGDCLNSGCIPSKSFIKIAKDLKNKTVDDKFNLAIQTVKEKIAIIENHDSISTLNKYKIDVIIGNPKIVNKNTIIVNNKEIFTKYIIIATGSSPMIPKIKGLDKIDYLTNNNFFEYHKKFESIAIIGAGTIGLELSFALNNLGINVELFDTSNQILEKEDQEIQTALLNQLKQEKIEINLNVNINEFMKNNSKTEIRFVKNGIQSQKTFDKILIATGRVSNYKDLWDSNQLDIKISDHKKIMVNKKNQTSYKNIYAVGDVANNYLSTNAAGKQATYAAIRILLKVSKKIDDNMLARVFFFNPMISSIGFNEKTLITKKKPYLVFNGNFMENDRAICESNTQMSFKILTDLKYQILGVILIGNDLDNLINFWTLAINKKIKLYNLIFTDFAYPTYGEAFRDLIRDLYFKINFKPKIKKIINSFSFPLKQKIV